MNTNGYGKILTVLVSTTLRLRLLVILTLFSFSGRDQIPASRQNFPQPLKRRGATATAAAPFQDRATPAVPSLDFIPAAPKTILDCEDLFGPDTPAAAFQMTAEYHERFPVFESAAKHYARGEWIEGFTAQCPTQSMVLHYLAGRPNVRNICETGFNLGHSAFNYLTTNPNASVHSFDIGVHRYTAKMALFLRRLFPGRIFVHFGDSRTEVPNFVRTHPDHRCQLIYVDGGHTYPVASADLLNMAAMADLASGNYIVFDDYPSAWALTRLFGFAWETLRRWGYVQELMRCSFKQYRFERGFVIGTVVRRPIINASETNI